MTAAVRHPAKYSPAVLAAIDKYLPQVGVVVDVFAGTGLLSTLATDRRPVLGVEIEPEWAEQDPTVIVGDALALPFRPGSVAAVATSPTFGNRMADGHDAKEKCRKCDGSGRVDTPHSFSRECPKCDGAGRNKYQRNTYKHTLGRDPHPNSSSTMQWGGDYRRFHVAAWAEAYRVLMPFGPLILNIKDHLRTARVGAPRERQHVSMWHVNALGRLGFALDAVTEIPAKGLRQGANHAARVETEYVMRFLKLPEAP